MFYLYGVGLLICGHKTSIIDSQIRIPDNGFVEQISKGNNDQELPSPKIPIFPSLLEFPSGLTIEHLVELLRKQVCILGEEIEKIERTVREHNLSLRKHSKALIWHQTIVIKIQEKQGEQEKRDGEALEWNVWNINIKEPSKTPRLLAFWFLFLTTCGGSIYYHFFRKKKEEVLENKSPIQDIKDKFWEWCVNIYGSIFIYFTVFILFRDLVKILMKDKTRLNELVKEKKNEDWIVLIVALLIGGFFILDGKITSRLKTPLQRLGIKIENSNLEEKEKKYLLSATQEANETMKETLKKFGLLALPPLVTALIEMAWNNNPRSLVCYLVPVLYASYLVWETYKVNREIERKMKELEN